jgi:hypothetical protein
MPAPKIVMMAVSDLRPFKDNAQIYGPASSNSAFKDIKQSMKQHGFFSYKPLLVTADKRVLDGCTRLASAKANDIAEVPCVVMDSEDEAEIGRAMLEGNMQRHKSQLVIAREQRYALQIESELARRRQGSGSDGGPSKSVDRVGEMAVAGRKESGKTVQHRLKILEAIEAGQQGTEAEKRKAEQLTELLEARQTTKALDLLDGKKKAPASAKPKSTRVDEDDDDDAPRPTPTAARQEWEAYKKSLRPVSRDSLIQAILPSLRVAWRAAQRHVYYAEGIQLEQLVDNVDAIAEACRGQNNAADILIKKLRAPTVVFRKEQRERPAMYGSLTVGEKKPVVQALFAAIGQEPSEATKEEAEALKRAILPGTLRNAARREAKDEKEDADEAGVRPAASAKLKSSTVDQLIAACAAAESVADVEAVEAEAERIMQAADKARRRLGLDTHNAIEDTAGEVVPLLLECRKSLKSGQANFGNARQLEICAQVEAILKRGPQFPAGDKALAFIADAIECLQKPEVGRPISQALDDVYRAGKALYRWAPANVKRRLKGW